MKELNEVRVPPTLLPTEKRQYLQPKAKKKKKKKIQKGMKIFIILCTKLLQKSQINFTPNNLQDSVPSIEKRYTKSIPFNEVKRIS